MAHLRKECPYPAAPPLGVRLFGGGTQNGKNDSG